MIYRDIGWIFDGVCEYAEFVEFLVTVCEIDFVDDMLEMTEKMECRAMLLAYKSRLMLGNGGSEPSGE